MNQTATAPSTLPALVFQDTTLDVIDHNGRPWLGVHQINDALGYRSRRAVLNLYKSIQEEFTESMTALVTLPTRGGPQEVRIFSLRGTHLLAMFARTQGARSFREWLLNILEQLNRERALTDPQGTAEHLRKMNALSALTKARNKARNKNGSSHAA